MSANYDFTCEQGADFIKTLRLEVKDVPGYEFTDWDVRMHVRRRLMDELPIIDIAPPLSPDGTITISIPATETEELSDDGVYDIELVEPDGRVHRLLQGRFILDREITRA